MNMHVYRAHSKFYVRNVSVQPRKYRVREILLR